jgi:hypothetical protein
LRASSKTQPRQGSSAAWMPGELSVPVLYRKILRAAKLFPSIKRNAIIADIKVEFREGQVRPWLFTA